MPKSIAHPARTNPNHKPAKAAPIVRKALQGISDDAGWYPLVKIGQAIAKVEYEFKPSDYGCRNLSTLLEKTGCYEVKEREGRLQARYER